MRRPARLSEAGVLRTLVAVHDLGRAGAQLCARDLIRGLRELGGFDIGVLAFGDGPLRAELESWGVPVHVTGSVPGLDAAAYTGRVAELAAWAEAQRFDVGLINSALSHPMADALHEIGVRTVWALHESYERSELWRSLEVRDPVIRARAERALREAAACVFPADATRALYDWCLEGGRGLVLPFPIDMSGRRAPEREEARRELGLSPAGRLVVCLGRIHPRKAQVPLAQAFLAIAGRHGDAVLACVGGDDEFAATLVEYVEGCAPPGRIVVAPVVSDVWPWLSAADVVVCASDVESLPRSVIEAMTAGRAVLATEIFGLPELIEDGQTGWLMADRDVRVLADRLDQVLGLSDQERSRVGAAARAAVAQRQELLPAARPFADVLRAVARGAAVDTSRIADPAGVACRRRG